MTYQLELDRQDLLKGIRSALFLGLLTGLALMVGCRQAQAYSDEAIVQAIYRAEGGAKAQYPYGIRSVSCATKIQCKEVCHRTVTNNRKRFAKYGHKRFASFLCFLASNYSPVGAGNDPKNLNSNWLKNVMFFLRRSESHPQPVDVAGAVRYAKAGR